MSRTRPNFLITGTPGVGKTTFSEILAERYNLVHIPVSRLIQDKHLWQEKDEERDCTIYDEDLLDEAIKEILDSNPEGGVIFDFHCSDIVMLDDIDYVLVLRTNSDILYKRLQSRGYSESKIQENTECEIFRVVLDEVLEGFEELGEDHIIEIQSDTMEQLDEAVMNVGHLIESYQQQE
ncbi:hypothetical protein TVAG_426750 [Trichomonas vaginalis G3]|uniref:Adenylate kinase isoenzyme 6 homolog n=1 Tax=Trichomonas vaginalis (strain ATCC PRA-98 / G3) TaxID=412133 RepID=A2DYU1_TRIV3|nr:adenylate kinase protein [Trichomonas vaginalis G3]EAY14481.1 hypothetical protein TVAG_426750 [Trichomonas vaginalis G3]KAI5519673.1 adenylate kinase protein [Trichomonas vaginalis G3]|eukprot:XP_001326704.1 hypothetical protein [Trichomonas vaginalis G3]